MGRRRRVYVILCAIFSFSLCLYSGLYLYLRSEEVFIHRAGRYGFTDTLGIKRDTNHFIEPATVREGPQIFALAIAEVVGESGELEWSGPRFEEVLREETDKAFEEQRTRNRMYQYFRPAAFFESLYWKIVDPDPLSHREPR